jgi:hypothetical protein
MIESDTLLKLEKWGYLYVNTSFKFNLPINCNFQKI